MKAWNVLCQRGTRFDRVHLLAKSGHFEERAGAVEEVMRDAWGDRRRDDKQNNISIHRIFRSVVTSASDEERFNVGKSRDK